MNRITIMSSTPTTDTPIVIPRPHWVISDTHFGHENILEYCPWRLTWACSLAEHDAALIAAWQACVQPDDWVLHLGDFCLGPRENIAHIRRLLPGHIILVRGNHDRSRAAMSAAGFDAVHSAVRIESDGKHWIGRHNPAAFSVREAKTAVRLLHGHCHGNGCSNHVNSVIRDMAVDCSLDAVRSVSPIKWSTVAT
jgi:calcineurin-like phosphoesterase family protein